MAPSVKIQMAAFFRSDPNLPALPDSVARVFELLQDEEVHFSDLAAAVERDPAMALAVLRLANSAAYSQPQEATTLKRAFAVIGLRQIPSLLAGFASVGGCETFLDDPSFRWDEFWKHCGGTAFIASSLARRLSLNLDGTEFLAGLLHDVGYLGMAKFDAAAFRDCVEEAREHKRFLPEVLGTRFGIAEPEVGYLLAKASGLGDEILTAIRHKADPEAAPEETRILVALVSLASQLAHLIGLTFCRGAADMELVLEQHPAWRTLQEGFPGMAEWDTARLVFELEKEYETSEVFVREARQQGGES